MVKKFVYIPLFFLLVLSLLSIASLRGEETAPKPAPSADAIIKASNKRIYGVKDEIAEVIFRVVDTDGTEKKTTFKLYWKNYFGNETLNSKTLLVTESPESDKGIKFLLWESANEDQADLWLYLPELRQVRRIQPGRRHHEKEPESDLLFEDMRQRRADQDDHRLLEEETVRGELCYAVENRPKKKSLYGKTVTYISKNDGTVRKIEYFSAEESLLKTQWIDWQEADGGFVWKASQIFNASSSRKTFVEVNDVRVNVGLPDDQFSERTLRK